MVYDNTVLKLNLSQTLACLLNFGNISLSEKSLERGLWMSGYEMVIVITAVGILILALSVHKNETKMQLLPYSTENAKY